MLEQANLVLEILRFQIRLAKDLQCLKVESYGFAAKALDEIGKLVGDHTIWKGTPSRNPAQAVSMIPEHVLDYLLLVPGTKAKLHKRQTGWAFADELKTVGRRELERE